MLKLTQQGQHRPGAESDLYDCFVFGAFYLKCYESDNIVCASRHMHIY